MSLFYILNPQDVTGVNPATEGYNEDGLWEDTKSEPFTFSASVQPDAGQVQMTDNGGERQDHYIKLCCAADVDLRGANQYGPGGATLLSGMADYPGTYRLIEVKKISSTGFLPHQRVRAIRLTEAVDRREDQIE
jgi:hypothetical protein